MPTISITDEIRAEILKDVAGEGGFQELMRRLQRGLNGLSLYVEDEDIQKIRRYTEDYKEGGFEDRLKPLLDHLRAQGLPNL
jgi:hypothetical protein